VRHAEVVRKNSVRLEPATREKIRELINKIKLTIESIDLPLPRKEALMAKLNAFATEVDRDRTRLEAFGALIIEVADGAAKVERKLRLRKWLDSIARLMHEARVLEEPTLACIHQVSAFSLRRSKLRRRPASCGHPNSHTRLGTSSMTIYPFRCSGPQSRVAR
jgi:hypothetical protein